MKVMRSSATARSLVAGMLTLLVVFVASCSKQSTSKSAEGVVDSLSRGDFATVTANCDPTLQSKMPTDKLGQVWTQVVSQIGPFKSRTSTRETEEQGYKVAYVTCQFEQRAMDIKVVFNDKGQISGLFMLPTKPSQ